MCTVTFLPQERGYALAMNRDEKRARAAGLPPAPVERDGRIILAPSEPSGGMWIAANDVGNTFALVNWYSIPDRVQSNPLSRGEIVRGVCGSESEVAADESLSNRALHRINPFRLIAVFPEGECIVEWRWDLRHLVRLRHGWRAQQWISSGFDEPKAQELRSAAFQELRTASDFETLSWLRGLHSSHLNGPGPFSTCMHRSDARTVSYTEIALRNSTLTMAYRPDSPCEFTGLDLPPSHTIEISRPCPAQSLPLSAAPIR